MALSFGEGWPFLKIRLEELVGEMLGEEGEHQIGALGIGDELSSQQNLLYNKLGIGKDSSSWRER